jgi:hypothetical protein
MEGKIINTTSGTWIGMPVGFDFEWSYGRQGNWDQFQTKEKLLEHFGAKTGFTAEDRNALSVLWDYFARSKRR